MVNSLQSKRPFFKVFEIPKDEDKKKLMKIRNRFKNIQTSH
jgi:hypothetical protein